MKNCDADRIDRLAPIRLGRAAGASAVRIGVAGCSACCFVCCFWLASRSSARRSRSTTRAPSVGAEVFGQLSAAHSARHRLSRPRHAEPHPLRRALHRRRRLRRRRCWPAAPARCSRCSPRPAGGWIDEVLSRTLDTLISIPSKMFALLMVAAFGSSVRMLILTAAVELRARRLSHRALARGQHRSARLRARWRARAARASATSCCWRSCPTSSEPMLADFGLRFVYVVLLLLRLSFLGLGMQPPDADWGSLVRENIGGCPRAAPRCVTPAIAIASLTIARQPGHRQPAGPRGPRAAEALNGRTGRQVEGLRVVAPRSGARRRS